MYHFRTLSKASLLSWQLCKKEAMFLNVKMDWHFHNVLVPLEVLWVLMFHKDFEFPSELCVQSECVLQAHVGYLLEKGLSFAFSSLGFCQIWRQL